MYCTVAFNGDAQLSVREVINSGAARPPSTASVLFISRTKGLASNLSLSAS